MNLSHIEAFLTLASTLNFTKASASLHTTQPNLSKIIVNLEAEVGALLFSRNKRDVRLTPAGESFREDMIVFVEQYQAAIDRARAVEDSISGSVNVGFLGTALIRHLPRMVNDFQERHPKTLLKLTDYTYSRLIEALTANAVDVALIPDRSLETKSKYHKKLIYSDDMCLVVSKKNPLAQLDSVDLQDVRSEPFIVMDPEISRWDYELITSICMEHGFSPKILQKVNSLNNIIVMVECGAGVSILAEHMRQFATENVAFVKIRGCEEYFRVSCIWQKEDNPFLQDFLNVV